MRIHGLHHIRACDAWYIRAVWCVLFHSRPRVPTGWHCNGQITISTVDGEEIKKLQHEAEGKLTSSMAELKQEVNSVQEETKLAPKITKSSYQFKHKGNEIQYSFNPGVAESISTTKSKWKSQKHLRKH